MPVRAPGRVSAEDNGRPKAEGKKLLFDNILQEFFRPTNGFIFFRPSSFNIKRQTFLPGERNELPFRDVFFELAHGLGVHIRSLRKEVRKRRASIHRSSPSDAVEHFLVSHVTGWAILGYPALELDTGIFPFVFFWTQSCREVQI